jgi:hypothetical protein
MSPEIDARQHLDNALRGRLFRGHLRLKSDLSQRAAGLWAAGKFSRFSGCGDKVALAINPPPDFHQAAQAFAGHQHQIIARPFDEAPDPGLDRRRIGRIVDGEHRTMHDIRALLGKQAGKLRLLARFQDQDTVAVQSVSHGFALTPIACSLFIMAPDRHWRNGAAGDRAGPQIAVSSLNHNQAVHVRSSIRVDAIVLRSSRHRIGRFHVSCP